MKKGEVITLKSGRDFVLSFTPVEPEGSKGAGRRWPGVTDDMWRSLFNALQEYKTVERNEVCKHYSVSYQKLLKQFGDGSEELTPLEQKYGRRGSKSPETPLEKIQWLQDRIAEHEKAIRQLQEDLVALKNDGMKELEAKLRELKNL